MTYFSTLTTLLRASTATDTGGEIGPKCFEAARRGLQSHLRCFPDYSESEIFSVSDFANWSVFCLLSLEGEAYRCLGYSSTRLSPHLSSYSFMLLPR